MNKNRNPRAIHETVRVRVSPDSLVTKRTLAAGSNLPLVVEPRMKGLDLVAWGQEHRESLHDALLAHGGVLFRGFDVTEDAFGRFIRCVGGEPLEYLERSSPRTHLGGNIYTSTDYPAEHEIRLHNENSYQSSWPLHIFFLCREAAATGGETPLAHCGRVLDRIDPSVRERFAGKGWMFVRNFGERFGLPWPTAFQTSDRNVVGSICRRRGLDFEWNDAGGLRVQRVAPAIIRHPRNGAQVWFNHAAFFHVSSLPGAARALVADEIDECDLPTMTYYGDGSPIESRTLDHIRSAYASEKISFPWRAGDLLMLDNMLAAHGRASYTGQRRVLVGMATAVERDPSWEPGMVAEAEEQS